MSKNKEKLASYDYSSISNWEVLLKPDTAFVLYAYKHTPDSNSNSDEENIVVFKFETKRAEEVNALINDYYPKSNLERSKGKEFLASNADINGYVRDLEKSRMVLLRKKLLLIPASLANSGKFDDSAIRNSRFLTPALPPVSSMTTVQTGNENFGSDWGMLMVNYLIYCRGKVPIHYMH